MSALEPATDARTVVGGQATISQLGTGTLRIGEGMPQRLGTGGRRELMANAVRKAKAHAEATGQTVELTITDARGKETQLRIEPDGDVDGDVPRWRAWNVDQASVRKYWIPLLLAGLAALLLLGWLVSTLVGVFTSPAGPERDAASQVRNMSVPGPNARIATPAEWSGGMRWVSPPLLANSGRVLVLDERRSVVLVTAERQVLKVDAESGQVRWAALLPDGALRSDLSLTRVNHHDVIAAHVGSQLVWWQPDTGERHEVALPSDQASVSFAGAAPLVGIDAASVGLVVEDRIDRVNLPAGSVGVAVRDDGTITATSPAGWWRLKASEPSLQMYPWETYETGHPERTVVAYLGGAIITRQVSDPTKVAVYLDRPEGVRFAFAGLSVAGARDAAWVPSPARTWGILGRTLIDVPSARVQDLGAWRTLFIGADRALGRIGTQSVLVGPTLPRGLLMNGEGFPEDLTVAGALVRGRDGNAEVICVAAPAR